MELLTWGLPIVVGLGLFGLSYGMTQRELSRKGDYWMAAVWFGLGTAFIVGRIVYWGLMTNRTVCLRLVVCVAICGSLIGITVEAFRSIYHKYERWVVSQAPATALDGDAVHAVPGQRRAPNLVCLGVEYINLHVDDHETYQLTERGGHIVPLYSAAVRFANEPPGSRLVNLRAGFSLVDPSGVRCPPIDRGAWVAQEYNVIDLTVGDSAALVVACGTPPHIEPQQQLSFVPINNHYSGDRYEAFDYLTLDEDWFDITVRVIAGRDDEIVKQYLFRLERIPHLTVTFVREVEI